MNIKNPCLGSTTTSSSWGFSCPHRRLMIRTRPETSKLWYSAPLGNQRNSKIYSTAPVPISDSNRFEHYSIKRRKEQEILLPIGTFLVDVNIYSLPHPWASTSTASSPNMKRYFTVRSLLHLLFRTRRRWQMLTPKLQLSEQTLHFTMPLAEMCLTINVFRPGFTDCLKLASISL